MLHLTKFRKCKSTMVSKTRSATSDMHFIVAITHPIITSQGVKKNDKNLTNIFGPSREKHAMFLARLSAGKTRKNP
jgi:hypothetical protein